MEEKPVVVVTGFGPFGVHTVNASWESVKNMAIADLENKHNVKIEKKEIPVVYKDVDRLIPSLWETHKPKLVIHVGVSADAKKLTLETVASHCGYIKKDCDGKCPADGLNKSFKEGSLQIMCGLNAEKLCNDYNKNNNEISACVSTNAGRYLCEYTYYASLSIDSSKTLFVHVPDLKSYPASIIAKGLNSIVDLCLNQINNCECDY